MECNKLVFSTEAMKHETDLCNFTQKQQLFYQAKKIQPPKQKENKQKIEYISRHSSIFFFQGTGVCAFSLKIY